MANQEELDILTQGVEAWNQWRKKYPDITYDPDLSYANLSYANLSYANLSNVHLNNADLSGAYLNNANLRGANLSYANLSHAHLFNAHLSDAHLSDAHLSDADLSYANLIQAYLSRANLSDANLEWTIFGNVDLSGVKGLETVKHKGPSTIGIDTIYRSNGTIPEVFLKNAGVPETFRTNMRALVDSMSPIDYYTCFISYSSKDQDFAERLYADLQSKGVRCWFAPEDMNIGDKIRHRIEESIRLYDKLLLVLSEDSIVSNWVAYEVEKALNKEPEGIPNVLYPIRLDDKILTCTTQWAKDIKSTRHIGDFRQWKSHETYQKAFIQLLRALKAKASEERT